MTTNGLILNDQVRLEIDASDLTNLISNHSGQTGNASGWAADANVTLSAVTNPTRTYGGTQTLQGTYTGGKTVAATYGSTAAILAETRSPSFAVTPSRYVGYQVSVGDPAIIDNANPIFTVEHQIRWYNSGGTLIGSSATTTYKFTPGQRPAYANTPWNVRTFGSTALAPSSAVTARVGLVMYETNVTTGAAQRINRTVYLTKLMVVTGTTSDGVTSVPFTDATAWQNVLGSSISVSINRGGDVDGVIDDIETGMMTARITDSTLDPATNSRATYGRKVRVTACAGNPGTDPFTPIFTGRITSIDTDYSSTKFQTSTTYTPHITITANDAVAELSSVSAPYGYAGAFADKVRALMALTTVPFIADSGTASTTKTSVNENATVWDQLLLARNGYATAKVFVDGSGNLVGQSFNRNATYSASGALQDYASHVRFFTMNNWAKNPSVENPNGVGLLNGLSASQVSDWSAQGTYSCKLSSIATSGQHKYYPITRTNTGSDSTGLYATMTTTAAFATMTVRAIAACRVSLKVDSLGGTNYATSFADLAAGDVTTLKVTVPAANATASTNAYLLITKSGGTVDIDTTGDLIYVDRIGVLQSADMTTAQATAYFAGDIYFDGSYVSPGIDAVGLWSGLTHESASYLLSGSLLSYAGYTATLGSKSVVNSLIINKRNVSELSGEKAYGPYLNPTSISKYGTAGAEITISDGDPTTLGPFYLSKYANPSVYVSELIVNATESDAWTNKTCLTELYDVISFQNSVSKVYGAYYVIGIEHDISPTEWLIKLKTRPIDQLYALSVGVTNGSGSMTSGPLDVIGPNGRAMELGGSVDLNTITAPGTYAQSQNTEAASGLNYPVPQAGLLEVAMTDTQGMVYQRYTVYNGGSFAGAVYTRTWYASTWSAWKLAGDLPVPAATGQGSDSGFPAVASAASTATVVIDRISVAAAPVARKAFITSTVYVTVSAAATVLNYVAIGASSSLCNARKNFATASVPDQLVVVGTYDIPANTAVVFETRLSRFSGTGTFTTSNSTNFTQTTLLLARVA